MVMALAGAATEGGEEEADHVAILEVGATGEREITERSSHFGPAIGIEVSPIENWLEIEFSAVATAQGIGNWNFLLKSRLGCPVWEIMPGLGLTWSHTTQPGEPASSWGAEAVLDLFLVAIAERETGLRLRHQANIWLNTMHL
jgi:hypothetical protein